MLTAACPISGSSQRAEVQINSIHGIRPKENDMKTRQVWLNIDGDGKIKLLGSTGVDFALPNSIVNAGVIQAVIHQLEAYVAGETGAA